MKKWLLLSLLILIGLGVALIVIKKPENTLEQKTLASLKQIADFPLYEMHYYGDYRFDDYLREGGGEVPTVEIGSEHFAESWACTCFAAINPQANLVFGRNFDWHRHPALILFTDPPDANASVSMVDISYLGYGVEFPAMYQRQRLLRAPFLPFDGMNEAGLAVGMMAVDTADGGHDPAKMTLEDLDVIRLLLDYANNVAEGIALVQKYNVLFEEVPLHYMLADREGNAAILEFIDGQLTVIRNQHPWQVSTNFIISQEQPIGAASSCWRYNNAYQALEQASGSITEGDAMSLLKKVSQGGDYPTIWSVVYNLSSGQASVVVDRNYEKIYKFRIGD